MTSKCFKGKVGKILCCVTNDRLCAFAALGYVGIVISSGVTFNSIAMVSSMYLLNASWAKALNFDAGMRVT